MAPRMGGPGDPKLSPMAGIGRRWASLALALVLALAVAAILHYVGAAGRRSAAADVTSDITLGTASSLVGSAVRKSSALQHSAVALANSSVLADRFGVCAEESVRFVCNRRPRSRGGCVRVLDRRRTRATRTPLPSPPTVSTWWRLLFVSASRAHSL